MVSTPVLIIYVRRVLIYLLIDDNSPQQILTEKNHNNLKRKYVVSICFYFGLNLGQRIDLAVLNGSQDNLLC